MTNIKGYKSGDWVKFVSTRPPSWNSGGAMDKWLGAIVKLRTVVEGAFNFEDETGDSYDYNWRWDSVERLATKEDIAKESERLNKMAEERKIQIIEERKELTYEIKDVAKIAEDIFGEERVHSIRNEVIIWWPEIHITNSKDEKHIVKDLYVRYVIEPRVFDENWEIGGYKANVRMEGIRSSFSVKEYESTYGHSHLKTGWREWNNFCVGTSDYHLLLENVRMSLLEEDWIMLFLSLENYLTWESLEGGPYCKIAEMRYNKSVSGNAIKKELQRIVVDVPKNIWDFTNGVLTPIAKHPKLREYFNCTSKIRDVHSYSQEELVEAAKKYKGEVEEQRKRAETKITWKKQEKEIQVYHEEIENDGVKPVSKVVSDEYCRILSRKGKEFIKKYTYVRAKQENREKVFGASGTH